MATPRIYAYREARLAKLADRATESVLAGDLRHVIRCLAEGRYSATARATLAALVAYRLYLEGHDATAAAFLLLVEHDSDEPARHGRATRGLNAMLPSYDDPFEERDAVVPWSVLLLTALWAAVALVLLSLLMLPLWLLKLFGRAPLKTTLPPDDPPVATGPRPASVP